MPPKRSTPKAVPLTLPPYGYMARDYEDGARNQGRPSQWKRDPESWGPWFKGVVATIGANVWPIYRDGTWTPGGAAENAVALTLEDLAAIRDFRAKFRLSFVNATGLYHADHTILEDTAEGWVKSIGAYCPDLGGAAYNFDKAREHCIFNFLGEFTPQAFKTPFQRPRPYQTALILEGAQLVRDDSASADTPSLISGHALQGLMVGCTIFESIREDAKLTQGNRDKLKAWMTGVGDRRVMAGIHYPSDSLASWIVAAELVDNVFANKLVREFLVSAIRGSLLYKFIEARSKGAYRRPWECLQKTLGKTS